eukprot:s225_g13.t1
MEFCNQLKCPEEFLPAMPDMHCSTCKETQQPKVTRPAAIHEPMDFGEVISMDGITWTNRKGDQFHVYHFIDQATSYHSAVCSVSRSAIRAERNFLQGWLQWAGAPSLVVFDAATESNSDLFPTSCSGLALRAEHVRPKRTDRIPGERHGAILQMMLIRMDHEENICSYSQMSMALMPATATKNKWSRYRGYPPEMLVHYIPWFCDQSATPNVPISVHGDSSDDHNDPEPEAAPERSSAPDSGDSSLASSSSLNEHIAPPSAETIVPVETPVPDDDDGLCVEHSSWFQEVNECFHLFEDQVWRFEVDVGNADIEKWRHEMSFLVSAAKKQRSEVKMPQVSDAERKLFHQAKMKEIDSWLPTETVAKALRHQIPWENILGRRWILTWRPVDSDGPG